MSILPTRRLSTRRGSNTALDPFGVHAAINHNPNRSSSSTLTIVRVASPTVNLPTPTLNDPPSSPVLNQRRLHRRITSTPSPAAQPDVPPQRMSFAFSTFSNNSTSSSSRDRAPSPSSSPRLRPSSPRLSATPFPTSKPRLTPDQLADLARQATNPVALPHTHSDPSSPLAHSPVFHSPHSAPAPALHPATFTPLPDDIFLPFIDRPSEVAALISSPPDVKLFTLLAQTFPKPPHPSSPSPPFVPSDQSIDLPRDPARWSYPHLIYHLTRLDRDIAPDPIWAFAARKCVFSHSELIWERIKGALGIPPELDVDYNFTRPEREDDDDDNDDDAGSTHTSDISDDEGRAARGHWSDWDATMDSPVMARHANRLSLDSLGLGRRDSLKQSDSPHVDRGLLIGSFSPPTITHEEASPDVAYDPETHVSIEPILSTNTSTTPGSNNPPPMSLGVAGDGLGDIAEGLEEEEEEAGAAASPTTTSATDTTTNTITDPTLISPSQIHGLRISTAPLPASPAYVTPPVLSPVSPLPPYLYGALSGASASIPSIASSMSSPSLALSQSQASISQSQTNIPQSQSPSNIPQQQQHSRPASRTSSFSSIGPFSRAELLANFSGSNYGGSNYASSDAGDLSDTPYDVGVGAGDANPRGGDHGYVGDRGAGTPLFPSNFARLGMSPTLRATRSLKGRSGSGGHRVKPRTFSHGSSSSLSMSASAGGLSMSGSALATSTSAES